MADRCTLAIHKLNEFKAWLDAHDKASKLLERFVAEVS